MDSMAEEDPTLPVNFEESANMAGLPDVTTGPPDITAANFSDHFPEGNMPAIQKISSGRMSPIRAHTMKDYEQQISELKKENFSLKLRIYFMEERIEQNFDDDTKTNIELRVETESLKKDLMEKQQLLVKASNAVESLAHEKDMLTDRLRQENNQALKHQRERLEQDLRQARQECESVKRANEILQKRLADAPPLPAQEDNSQQMNEMKAAHQEAVAEKDRRIDDLKSAVEMKDATISQLESEKQYAVDEKTEPLQQQLQQLQHTLDNRNAQLQAVKEDLDKEKGDGRDRDRQYEEAFKEQERRLKDLEAASEDMQTDLKNKDKEIKEFNNALRKAKQEKKDLEQEIVSKDLEKKAQESNTMKRDKAIQGLVEDIRAKDKEIRLLCDQADERESALTQAREALHKVQRNKYEGMEQYQATVGDMEGKLAEQKGQLHSKQLEVERLQKTLARKQQELDRQRQDGNEAEQHLNDLLEQRELTIKELKGQLQDAKLLTDEKVDAIEQHYQGLLDDSQQQLQNKDKNIQRLTKGLQDKDRLVQEYMELSRDANKPTHDDNGGNSALIQTLRERVKQRDKAVEEAVEEKLQAAEAKEREVRQLRASLRERERSLERAHNDHLANQDRINQLHSQVKEQEAKGRQLQEALDAHSQAEKDADGNRRRSLAERDSIIQSLQRSLAAKEKALAELQEARRAQSGDAARERDEVIEQLKTRLRDKDKMIEEVLAERSQAVLANEKASTDLLDTIRDKDNQIKELHERQNRLTANKNNVIKELQKELNDKEYSVQAAEDTLCRAEQEQAMLLNKMRAALADKDKTIQKLIDSGREKDRLFQELQQSAARQTPSPTAVAELAGLRDKMNGLKQELREKDATLRDLQGEQPDDGFVESLRTELDNKNKLLAKAKNTIDSLQKELQAEKQNKQEVSKLRRQLLGLESEVQGKQDHIDALVHAGKIKDNVIKEIRLEQANVPVRSAVVGGEDGNNQLQQILQDQMRELGRLSDTLRAERQLYVNITQSGGGGDRDRDRDRDGSPRSSHASAGDSLSIELAAVQALRRQLEDGIRRNDAIRQRLETQLSQPDQAAVYPGAASVQSQEMQSLRHQLEDSSRWNASLQSRLDEMRQRVGGVGRDPDPDQDQGQTSGRSSPASGEARTVAELQRELAQLRRQLLLRGAEEEEQQQQQQRLRRQRSLEEVPDRGEDVESLRSIPGQEEDAAEAAARTSALQRRNRELEQKLAESEQARASCQRQLEAALLNRGDGGEEEDTEVDGGPVVAILKQQLDQAKTLLREKDARLQQREQQNQALRHHLGIGPDSPIHSGRSLLAGLHQENAQLRRDGQSLARQLQSHQVRADQLQRANEDLQQQQQQLGSPPEAGFPADDQLVPVLKNQLDQAKALIQEKDRQNQSLRQILRMAPDAPLDEGLAFIEKLQARSQQLKAKLSRALQESESLRAELDSVSAELEQLKPTAAAGTPRGGDDQELRRLQKQLSNAQNLNELLKRHIDLNTSQETEQPAFNPELIVDMAREIERLQEELSTSQERLSGAGQPASGSGGGSGSPSRATSVEVAALGALRRELERAQAELDELRRKHHALQVKLQATEGTVHHQAGRLNRYRRQMHNAGLAPPSTPKRVRSDSNLSQLGPSLLTSPSPRRLSSASLCLLLPEEPVVSSAATSPCPSERDGDVSLPGDVGELREQISQLRAQVDRYKRLVKHLQRRLRGEEQQQRSRSPAMSECSSSSSSWYELTANQDAFERLKQEVQLLQAQVQDSGDANATLAAANDDLRRQLQEVTIAEAPTPRGRSISDELLRAQQDEADQLRRQLQESQSLCALLKSVLNEAVVAMEEVAAKQGARAEKGEDSSGGDGLTTSKMSHVQAKMLKTQDIAEKLNRALEEPSHGTKVTFIDVSSRPLYIDSLEAKDRQIARLKKELRERKQLNHKLRDLLAENQKVAVDTREDLQRLTAEVEEKNGKISELHGRLRESIRASSVRRPPSGDGTHLAEAPDTRRQGGGFRQGLWELDDDDADFTDVGASAPGVNVGRELRGSAAGQSEPAAPTPAAPSALRPSRLPSTSSSTSPSSSPSSPRTAGAAPSPAPGASRPQPGREATAELAGLRSRLRDTERLNSALKAELEIYKSALGGGGGGGAGGGGLGGASWAGPAPGAAGPAASPPGAGSGGRGDGQQDPHSLLAQHLDELRQLRRRLEESIRVNDRLREQLEARLAGMGQQYEGSTIIRLEQTNVELTETNSSLEMRVAERDRTIRDLRGELQRLEPLRQELQGKESSIRDLRGELQVRDRTIQDLRGELKRCRSSRAEIAERDRTIADLRSEIKLARRDVQKSKSESERMRDQIEENAHLAESLRFELSVYEHLHTKDDPRQRSFGGSSPRLPNLTDPSTGLDLSDLLREMRHLRIQLERSISTNSALRQRLEEMMATKTTTAGPAGSPPEAGRVSLTTVTMAATERGTFTSLDAAGQKAFTPRQLFKGDVSVRHVACQTALSGQAMSSAFYMADGAAQDEEYYSIPGVAPLRNNRSTSAMNAKTQCSDGGNGLLDETGEGDLHAIGTLPTYDALGSSLREGRLAADLIDARLAELIRSDPQDLKDLKDLKQDVGGLRGCLEQCSRLLGRFWKGRLPPTDQVARLRRRLRAQDDLMKEALQRLNATNRLKEDMELALINQLSQTHDVLRQARGNLEAQSSQTASSPLH